MAKGLPSAVLHLATAQGRVNAARMLLKEKLHEDDRKQIDDLLSEAESKMDSADAVLRNLRERLDGISDQLI